MEHNAWVPDSTEERVFSARLLVVEHQIKRIDGELQRLSEKLDGVEDIVRETRDIVFEMRGRSKNGSADVMKALVLALVGALLALVGVKLSQGGL